MNDDRARQRAGVDIKYDVGPRLLLLMQSKYIDTNTQADLNVDTGLAALRAHGRSLSVGSSARNFRADTWLGPTRRTVERRTVDGKRSRRHHGVPAPAR